MLFIFLLGMFSSRLINLTALPLHMDEALHLTRAVEVWNGHPFWQINDGKIINHWLIALFFPQTSPVFVARIATVLVVMLGYAGALRLAHLLGGERAMWVVGLLWLMTPYLLFYERISQSDAQAGAWVTLSILFAVMQGQDRRVFSVILSGLTLSIAILFKFTAAPYCLTVAFIMLVVNRQPFAQRIQELMLIAGLVLTGFIPPMLYVWLKGDDFFRVALEWVGIGGQSVSSISGSALAWNNLLRFWQQLIGFGEWAWVGIAVLGVGLIAVALWGNRAQRLILVAVLLPLSIMIVVSKVIYPRHFVVTFPLIWVMAAVGWSLMLNKLSAVIPLSVGYGGLGVACALLGAGFMLRLLTDPTQAKVPVIVQQEFFSSHSSGYGLREAMDTLPSLVDASYPVIASMFPPSCRRANFYAVQGFELICTDAPALERLDQELQHYGRVYVLTEQRGEIGATPEMLQEVGAVTLLQEFDRPYQDNPAIGLYQLDQYPTTP